MKVDKGEILKHVSTGLYQTRWGLGLYQPDVAEQTGITRPQLSNYERGVTLPSLLSIIALADLYDVSIDYLVGRCENKQAHKTPKAPTKFREDVVNG